METDQLLLYTRGEQLLCASLEGELGTHTTQIGQYTILVLSNSSKVEDVSEVLFLSSRKCILKYRGP